MNQPLTRVFIVDDHPENIKILDQFLREQGFRVLIAQDGLSALQKIPKALPDLILLDVAMPAMDGFEVCRHLKQHEATRDIPVIFMTALAETEHKVRGLAAGAVDYITKPFQQEEVLARIQTHLTLYRLRHILQMQNQELAAKNELLQKQAAVIEQHAEQIEQTNVELARAAQQKDEFLASMSHELRTPINVVLNMAELLQEGIYGQLTNDKQIRAIQIIEESSQHLLAMINDILDIAKSGAGRLAIELQPIYAHEVMESTLTLMKQLAHRKHLQLHHYCDPQVDIIQGDPRRLKQILVNLLGNAVKFTPEYGEIGLEIRGAPERRQVRLCVWDTGIGIAPEAQPRIFEAFTQIDSGLARQYNGTGLGLAIVKRLVELHGGTIELDSQPGQGSRFSVVLPWHPAARPAPAASLPAIHNGSAAPVEAAAIVDMPLIVIAEDNHENRLTLEDYLGARGYRVVGADNGETALELIREQQPDVVLMDIQMPGLDGLEVLRRMRGDGAMAKIPVIALTAMTMPGDSEKCLNSGANAYLSKPFKLNEVLAKVREFVA
jgi:signal transduction histidine kinase